jgi:cell division septation protein DedD
MKRREMKNESTLTLQITALIVVLFLAMIFVTACGGGGTGVFPDPNPTSTNPTSGPTGVPTALQYGNVTGTVTNSGATVAGAYVVFYSHIFGQGNSVNSSAIETDQGNYFTTTTGSQGVYDLNNVYAGPGRVAFWLNEASHNLDPNNPLGAKEVIIIANQTITANISQGSIDPTPSPLPTQTPIPGATATPTSPPITAIPTVPGGNVAPEAPTNLQPINGSTNQPINNLTFKAACQDANANPMSARFQLKDGTLLGIDPSVAPGTYAEIVVSGLAYNTTYEWCVIANDGTVDSPQSATVSFTTVAANTKPDQPSNLDPANNAVDQPTTKKLKCDYRDTEGSVGSAKFYVDGTLKGTATNVVSGTTAEIEVTGLAYSTSYNWYCIANDGSLDSDQSATYKFTTQAAPVADPTITSWTVRNGYPGQLTTVTGTNFGTDQGTVTADDAGTLRNAVITAWSPTSISFYIQNGNFVNTMNHVAMTIKRSDNKTVVEPYFMVYSDFTTIFTTPYGPADACLDNAGYIFITDSDLNQKKIHRYDFPSMTNMITSTMFGSPPSSIIWNSSNNKLYNSLGTFSVSLLTDFSNISNFGAGILAQARGIGFLHTTNEILFADLDRIQKFSLDGVHNLAGSFDFKYSTAIGISSDQAGNIYVGDANADKMVKYTENGVFVEEWNRDSIENMTVKVGIKTYLYSLGHNSANGKINLSIDDVTSTRVNVGSFDFDIPSMGAGGIYVDQNDGTIIIVDSGAGNILAGTI